jgi:hypothetical protein
MSSSKATDDTGTLLGDKSTNLSAEDSDDPAAIEELNCIIYRGAEDTPPAQQDSANVDQIWTATKDKVTVYVWESKANIRIRVSQSEHKDISMEKIADIAVKAIIGELQGDQQ